MTKKDIVKEVLLELTDISYQYKPVGIMVDFGIGMYAEEDYEILSAYIKYVDNFKHVQISEFTNESKQSFIENVKNYCLKAKEYLSDEKVQSKIKEIEKLEKKLEELKGENN